ncbi:MAG: ATP-binding cassette domain-containing protein [Alkalispirochaeta sp.]
MKVRLEDGKPVHFRSGNDGEDLKVVLIHQEFNLAPHLTVAENIFLGREERTGPFLIKKLMNRKSREVLSRLHTDIAPDRLLYTLSMAQWQLVEIAKALSREAHILIMDEPTAVLTPNEIEILFEQIQNLRASGVTVIYISHNSMKLNRSPTE